MSTIPTTAPAEKKAEKTSAKKQLAFPRDMKLVNETPIPYVVARTHVAPGKSATVHVQDEDELQRIKTDCEHLMEVNGSYKGLEVQPLRLTEAD